MDVTKGGAGRLITYDRDSGGSPGRRRRGSMASRRQREPMLRQSPRRVVAGAGQASRTPDWDVREGSLAPWWSLSSAALLRARASCFRTVETVTGSHYARFQSGSPNRIGCVKMAAPWLLDKGEPVAASPDPVAMQFRIGIGGGRGGGETWERGKHFAEGRASPSALLLYSSGHRCRSLSCDAILLWCGGGTVLCRCVAASFSPRRYSRAHRGSNASFQPVGALQLL